MQKVFMNTYVNMKERKMTEWQTKLPGSGEHEATSMALGEVRELPMPKIRHAMKVFPDQFAWAKPNLLKRIAPDDGKMVLDIINRTPEGVSLGVLINKLRNNYDPDTVTKLAAKLEADGQITSVRSVHKYNKKVCYSYLSSTS